MPPQGTPEQEAFAGREAAPSRIELACAWGALAVGVLLTAYGLWSRQLFAQTLWTAAGQQKLTWLVSGYVVWSAITLSIRHRWSFLATSAVLALGLSAAVGYSAVGAGALFLVS